MILAAKMASEHAAEAENIEIKSEEDSEVPEVPNVVRIPRIMHDEHSPSMCAMQVQLVFERNLRREQHLMEMMDRNCKYIEENGKLTTENLRAKLRVKESAAKVAKMQEEVQKMEKELQKSRETVTRLREAQLDASMAKEDHQIELEHARSVQNELREMYESVKKDLAIQKELTANANQNLMHVLEQNKTQNEAAVQCMMEAKRYAAQKDEELASE